jgi:serine/threonine protein kinase
MYDKIESLHVGRHTVESAEFGGVRVVLKKFHIGADAERAAFLKEARRLRQLAHPNVLVLNLVFIEAQAGYLELEFCEQGHLWQWLERAPPRSFGERVAVLQQALRGLEHVHRAGVVHCDVTCSHRHRASAFLAIIQPQPPLVKPQRGVSVGGKKQQA